MFVPKCMERHRRTDACAHPSNHACMCTDQVQFTLYTRILQANRKHMQQPAPCKGGLTRG